MSWSVGHWSYALSQELDNEPTFWPKRKRFRTLRRVGDACFLFFFRRVEHEILKWQKKMQRKTEMDCRIARDSSSGGGGSLVALVQAVGEALPQVVHLEALDHVDAGHLVGLARVEFLGPAVVELHKVDVLDVAEPFGDHARHVDVLQFEEGVVERAPVQVGDHVGRQNVGRARVEARVQRRPELLRRDVVLWRRVADRLPLFGHLHKHHRHTCLLQSWLPSSLRGFLLRVPLLRPLLNRGGIPTLPMMVRLADPALSSRSHRTGKWMYMSSSVLRTYCAFGQCSMLHSSIEIVFSVRLLYESMKLPWVDRFFCHRLLSSLEQVNFPRLGSKKNHHSTGFVPSWLND